MRKFLEKYGRRLLIITTACAVLISVLSFVSATSGFLQNAVGVLTYPFRSAVTAVATWAEDKQRYYKDYSDLIAENEALRERVAELERDARQAEADREENALLRELLHLVDEDTAAFNRIMAVFAMPKSTDEEKAARSAALQAATLYATQVPLRTMKTAFEVFAIVRAMAAEGNPNSVSDAGVGALAARSAVLGACLNVKINAAGLKDRAAADALVAEANAVAAAAERAEREVLEIVERKI